MKILLSLLIVFSKMHGNLLAEQPKFFVLSNPDLIVESFNLPKAADVALPRFKALFNPQNIALNEIGTIIQDLNLKSRCQIVSKIRNGKRIFQIFQVSENSIVVEGAKKIDFLIPRELFYYLARGEISINWDKWSGITFKP